MATMETITLARRLPPEVETRLAALARKTGRTECIDVREAVLRHIEDLDDEHLARRCLARRAPRVALAALEAPAPYMFG
jgi:RHH-type transcriptional regulator, rel operon repressor / antitoxin RelB